MIFKTKEKHFLIDFLNKNEKNCLISLNHERQATKLVEIMKENCLITQDHERQINVRKDAINLIPFG